MKGEDTGVSVSLHSLSFPVGLSVDAWWPSLSHISTYGMGLNKDGGGPFTLTNSRADNLCVNGQLISYISLWFAFMHENPRSYSADDIGNKQIRWNNACSVFPMRRILFLYSWNSFSASTALTWHNLAKFTTCWSPNRARWFSSSGQELGLRHAACTYSKKLWSGAQNYSASEKNFYFVSPLLTLWGTKYIVNKVLKMHMLEWHNDTKQTR